MKGVTVLQLVLLCSILWEAGGETQKKKKSILDYNEVDVERIFQQWEENDEDRDEDDDSFNPFNPPPPGPPLDLEALRSSDGKIDPQQLMKLTKKDKPVMMFIAVRGDPNEVYTQKISARWMQSLQNAHMPVQRYIVAPDRVMFMIQDGSKAWEVKDYLVTQTECINVTFEQQTFACAEPKDEL